MRIDLSKPNKIASNFPIVHCRASELTLIDKEIQCGFKNALDLRPGDCVALKEYGCYAYNFYTNIRNDLSDHQSVCNDGLLDIAQRCFEQLKQTNGDWFAFYMLGKIRESYKDTPLLDDAAKYYEQSLNELWLNCPEVPETSNDCALPETSLQKLELLYRLVGCALDHTLYIWDKSELAVNAYYVNCLTDQNAKFGIKLIKLKTESVQVDVDEVDELFSLCVCGLQYCLATNERHLPSIHRLAWVYLKGPEEVRNIKTCAELVLGVYKIVNGPATSGLFTNRSGTNLFSVSIFSVYKQIPNIIF